MKSIRLKATGANLLYHDIPGHGLPLIFIHGLGCASSCDYPVVASDPALAGRRIMLVDLLGAGFSDRPAEFGYTVADHARSVVEFVEAIAPEAIDLFGHSMGGSVAIVAASLLGERIRSLVLSEPNLDPGGGIVSGKIAAMSEADYVAHGHDHLVRASRIERNHAWAASLAVSAPFAVHRGARSLVAGSEPTWREVLRGLSIPRTVIFGETSLPNSADPRQLQQQGVNIGIVPKAGHGMASDNPAGLALTLRQALRLA
ncbi:alpha/beta fold hydrolase [Bradyrhizobium sp. UFLA05-112]